MDVTEREVKEVSEILRKVREDMNSRIFDAYHDIWEKLLKHREHVLDRHASYVAMSAVVKLYANHAVTSEVRAMLDKGVDAFVTMLEEEFANVVEKEEETKSNGDGEQVKKKSPLSTADL